MSTIEIVVLVIGVVAVFCFPAVTFVLGYCVGRYTNFDLWRALDD